MIMYKKILIILPFLGFQQIFAVTHRSSYPYIAGDTFIAFCDFALLDTQSFDPTKVQEANTIFVQTDLLPKFFTKLRPLIKKHFILITHNCGPANDDPMPGPYRHHLNDHLLIAWFTQNIDVENHRKLFALPIGIANQNWPHGRIEVFDIYIKQYRNNTRDKLLYQNFSVDTYRPEREYVYNLFAHKPFCTVADISHDHVNHSLEQYLEEVSHHKFVLSPRGHGLDCHRTWEALLMGSIPIVKSSTLDVLYKDLPVLIIHDWNEVTEDFLNQKYNELTHKEYCFEKLYAPYWFKKIREVQKKFMTKSLIPEAVLHKMPYKKNIVPKQK